MAFLLWLLPILSIAVAQENLNFINKNYNGIAVNEPFNITWAGGTGAVSLTSHLERTQE